MEKNFNDFRFEGLNYKNASNKYWTMNRINETEDRIIVKVASEHLIQTRFGYALILDKTHVVFLKEWAVSCNWFGNEVLLTKQYFNVKEWGEHNEFEENEENLSWNAWIKVAKEQQKNEENPVKWEK